MINGKGRHVVVMKLLLLIIAEYHNDIGIRAAQGIAQSADRIEASLIALLKLFIRQFRRRGSFSSFSRNNCHWDARTLNCGLWDVPTPITTCAIAVEPLTRLAVYASSIWKAPSVSRHTGRFNRPVACKGCVTIRA